LLRKAGTRTRYAELVRFAINAAQEYEHRIVASPAKLQLPDAFPGQKQGGTELKMEPGHAD
jgi:hypothetical protein